VSGNVTARHPAPLSDPATDPLIEIRIRRLSRDTATLVDQGPWFARLQLFLAQERRRTAGPAA
jgi:hypothetical protein